MNFTSITITNLFSYYGTCIFDLKPPKDDGRNIVVIQGRNGYGKTSFLNSIKLLFGGITEDLTRQVSGGTSIKQYVLGNNKDWWGILNHHARNEAKPGTTYSVSITCQSEKGEFSATRSWREPSYRKYQGELKVIDEFGELRHDDVAQEDLNKMLPGDYLPFFFFDGEEVRHLAEANTNQNIEKMERLLNVGLVENALGALNEVRRNWQKQSMNEQARAELTEKEHKANLLAAQIRGSEQERDLLRNERNALEDELEHIDKQLDIIGRHATVEHKAGITAELKGSRERHLELKGKVSELFGNDGFLMLAPALVEKVINHLQLLSTSDQQDRLILLESLQTQLSQLFDTPPFSTPLLTEGQKRFYKQKLAKQLEVYNISSEQEGPFSLDTKRCHDLLLRLAPYTEKSELREDLLHYVASARELQHKINGLELQLENAENLNEENLVLYRELKKKREEKYLNIREVDSNLGQLENRLSSVNRDYSKCEKEINEQRKKVAVSDKFKKRYDLTINIQNMLKAYKLVLKSETREELEKTLNRHLSTILDSNRLIHRVAIDENFSIRYFNSANEPIGMGSFSFGMKQLAATALLWALKEVSRRDVPVVIDTPMARIDLQHQHNLLTRYYPKVGRQVIILPTDSELTPEKKRLLEPYIYKFYELENPNGEQTVVKEVNLG